MKWFRLYDDLVYNAKVQNLPPRLFKHLINLWCLASRNEPRGYLPSVDRIAFALRMKPNRVSDVLQMLSSRGFVDECNLIHDWSATQRESDDSAIRKQAQRDNKIAEKVTGQSHGKTASDTDTEQIQIQNRAEGDLPTAEKRAGRPDPAAELFKAAYLANVGNPYGWQGGDFPQLAKLRKRLGIATDATPADWEHALLNYFASPFSEFSLKHFTSKFDTFKNSSLDRFKTPVNHRNGNGQHESKGQALIREQQFESARLDQILRGSTGDDARGSDTGGTGAPVRSRLVGSD